MEVQPEDMQYAELPYRPSEVVHEYGDRVHILSDPWMMSNLVRLCAPQTVQPQVTDLVCCIYQHLAHIVTSAEFPTRRIVMPTRMIEATDRGIYRGLVVDPDTRTVVVDMVRAGILPSHVCYTQFSLLLNPSHVRQDHIVMQRTINRSEQVTGAAISGQKIGGDVEDTMLIVPDPMGATGSSMIQLLDMYRDEVEGTPRKIIALHLIVTPEYIRAVHDAHPTLKIYAARLDRGMSPAEVLSTCPGSRWGEEIGLTDKQYIVPGGGGFGEIMNNTAY